MNNESLELQERMKKVLVRQSKLIKLLHDEIKAGGMGFYHEEAMALVDKAVLELAEAVAEIVEEEV
jgi:hypothetical protein